VLIKKYGNRRLYDTEESCYITLEDLAAMIRDGADVTVIDAKTGQDLTQSTLAQIILESRGAARLLPTPLLKQLIRMGDDALAEFFSRYMTWALEIYAEVRRGTQQSITPFAPFTAPLFGPAQALSRILLNTFPWAEPPAAAPPSAAPSSPAPPSPPPPSPPRPDPDPDETPIPHDEIAELRREIEELKRAVGRRSRR
jgi:polyhydroxyalkanoate synthesis repressor PhaR